MSSNIEVNNKSSEFERFNVEFTFIRFDSGEKSIELVVLGLEFSVRFSFGLPMILFTIPLLLVLGSSEDNFFDDLESFRKSVAGCVDIV